jgi:hypothetical protein
MSEDPIGFDGDASNLYRYCENSPGTYTDPTGEFVITVPVIVGGIAVAAVATWFTAAVVIDAQDGSIDGPRVVCESIVDACTVDSWGVMYTAENPAPPLEVHMEESVPDVDETGKFHGDIPEDVPSDWTKDDLEDAEAALEESIRTRTDEQNRLGEHGPHRRRIREEQEFLRWIRNRLERIRLRGPGR